MAQEYQEFASDFTGSVTTLQQNTCRDFVPAEIPIDIPCPTCIPDPNAIVPEWIHRDSKSPFLNEKTCQYSITIITQYEDLIANTENGVRPNRSRAAEYAGEAIRKLMRYYNKLETDLLVDVIVNGHAGSPPAIEATDQYLGFEQGAKLKLLYTINAFNFDGLPPDTEDPSAFNEEEKVSAGEFTIDLSSLSAKLDRMTRILTVYGYQQAALRNIDNGSFIFENTNKEFIIGSLRDETSTLYEFSILEQTINDILERNGFDSIGNLTPKFATLLGSRRSADYIKIGYGTNFAIDKITIIETGCPNVILGKKKVPSSVAALELFTDESPLNNPTIVAYLSRISEMYDEATAMEAPTWTDFLIKYTFPTLTINYGANTIFTDQDTLAECIASAVADYGTTITNRALDALFSFPDALAQRLNEEMCFDDEEKATAAAERATQKARELGDYFEKVLKAIREKPQFQKITIIKDFAQRLKRTSRSGRGKLINLFNEIFDEYGFCGMLALLKAAIACVSYGFSFEEILKKIVEVGMKQLTPLQMSQFLVLLPPDKKAEVMAKVDKILQENDIVGALIGTATVSDPAAFAEERAELEKLDELQNASASSVTEAENKEASATSTRDQTASDVAFSPPDTNSDAATSAYTAAYADAYAAELNTQTYVAWSDGTWQYSYDSSSGAALVGKTLSSMAPAKTSTTKSYIQTEGVSRLAALNEITDEALASASATAHAAGMLAAEAVASAALETAYGEAQTDLSNKEQATLTAQSILAQNTATAKDYRKQLGSNALGQVLGKMQAVIMQAYIDAILEFVDVNEIYEILTKFPGVKILADLVKATNCPSPPGPEKVTWLNFLNTLEIEWCHGIFDITMPPKPVLPDLGAFFSTLWKTLSILAKEIVIELITKILYEILLKLLEILMFSLCDLLDKLVAATSALIAGQNPETIMLDMLREAFGCPPVDSEEQNTALLEAVGQVFGGQGGDGFTTEEVAKVLQTTSVSLTAYEFGDLLKGRLPADKTRYLKTVLRASSPKFASLFPNEGTIAGLFSTLGNLIPDKILSDYEKAATDAINLEFPANLSTCGTPESIDKFKKLREDILKNKGLTDDEIANQLKGMQNRADENLKLLVDLAAKGIGNVAGEKLMVSMLGPDALQDPMSALANPACPTALRGSPYSSIAVAGVHNSANQTMFGTLKVSYLNGLFKEPLFFDALGKKPWSFLGAVLSDKSGRDYIKHNKDTQNIFFPLYNDKDQETTAASASALGAFGAFTNTILGIPTVNDHFPITVSKLTQTWLATAAQLTDTTFKFSNNIGVYDKNDTATPKRAIFRKKEDYSLSFNAANSLGPHILQNPNGRAYHLLYSQFTVNNQNAVSPDNTSRLAVMTEIIPGTYRRVNGSALEISSSSATENYDIIYQSKFELDESTAALKEQYLPTALINSPQADCFTSFMQTKINIGAYDSPSSVTVDLFNKISNICMKSVISTLTDNEGYLYGYNYFNERITQEDIDLDPETLERKTDNPRVIILDYKKFGGTADQPPVYITPPIGATGWLGVARSIMPEFGCTPKAENIIDFDELSQLQTELQTTLSDDPDLMYGRDCREQVPYLKALSSTMAANLQISIIASMRVSISETILRCIPLYNKFVVSYDNVIDELYLDYIMKKMEEGLINQGEGIFQIKTDTYYLYFIEQCVQIVSRKLLAGEIELTLLEQQALDSINAMIKKFYFVKEKDYARILQSFAILNGLEAALIPFKANVENPAASAALFILYGPLAPIVISTVTYTAFVAALATSAQEYPALEPYIETISELYLEYSTVSLLSNEVKNKILQKLKEVVEIIADERVKDVNVSDPILNNVLRNITRSGAVIKPLLQDFRKEMILEGIRQTKIEARILVRKIMKEEFRIMAANFAAHIYTKPTITNLRTYFLNTDTKLIAPNNKLRYFDVAIDAEDNPLNSITTVPAEPLIVKNPEGYFILERYIRIQDREIPLSGTIIPDEIKNRPENINGVVNVPAFKNWISTLSTETKQTEMYKLFGDLSVTGSSAEGFQLTGSTLGLKYGLRMSHVPSAEVMPRWWASSAGPVSTEKAYALKPAVVGKEYLLNSQFIIPVASVEIDLVNEPLNNFDSTLGTNIYNHECMVAALAENDEFRFLFYYCFPLQKYMSAISAFISETYVKLIGISDDWSSPPEITFTEKEFTFYEIKETCQIFFETYYNWEDTSYKNATLSSKLNGVDPLIQSLQSLLSPIGTEIYAKDRIVPRRPFDEEGQDCDSQKEGD